MKKLTVFLGVLVLLSFSAMAWGQQFVIGPDGSHRPYIKGDDAIPIPFKDRPKIEKMLDPWNILTGTKQTEFVLTWRTKDSPEVNFGFDTGDSLAQWFKPLAACILKAVRIYVRDFEGSAIIDIWGSNYDGHITTTDSTDGNGWIGDWVDGQWVPGDVLKVSPLADHIWGPFPISITADDANSWIETETWILGEPDIGNRPFHVGYYMSRTAGWGFGCQFVDILPYHFFKFYISPHPTFGKKGWLLRSFSMWVECVVEYYENIAPVISEMTYLPNTYSTGPFTITANITDFDPDPTLQGVAAAYIVYSTDGWATKDSVAMSGPAGGGVFTGDIPTMSPGTEVSYYVTAIDPPGLYSVSAATYTFYIGKPTEGEDFLVLNQPSRYGEGTESYFTNVIDALGYDYDYMYGRCDSTIWLPQYTTVFLLCDGLGSPPTALPRNVGDNPLKSYLDQGGNLLVCSDELIGVFYGWPGALTTSPGEFIHDYLHVLGAESDAPFEKMLDVPGDGFTDALTDTIGLTFAPGWENYGDVLTIDDQAAPLYVEAEDTVFAGGEVTGVKYDGDYKVIFFPFMLSALDSTTRAVVLKDVLTFFGTTGVQEKPTATGVPLSYSLEQNYPNPFNPETKIQYTIPYASNVKVAIYNLLGQKVVDLVDKYQEAGRYQVAWDGRDATGKKMASGVYICRLEAGDFVSSKKMILLK